MKQRPHSNPTPLDLSLSSSTVFSSLLTVYARAARGRPITDHSPMCFTARCCCCCSMAKEKGSQSREWVISKANPPQLKPNEYWSTNGGDRGTKSRSSSARLRAASSAGWGARAAQAAQRQAGRVNRLVAGDDEMGKQKVIHKIRAPLSTAQLPCSPASAVELGLRSSAGQY